MAFTAITTSQVATGEPTKQELFDLVRTNFNDHESRLGTVENAVTTTNPITFECWGPYGDSGAQTDVILYRVTASITFLSCRLIIIHAGTAGTTEIDIQKAAGAGAFSTIFATRPSVAFGSGDRAVSTNAVLSSTTAVAGDFLRLDITSVQTAASDFIVQLEYEAT